MRLVFAHISAHYEGRGDTVLSPHDRLVLLKADGTVAIHADKGYKPVNYMATVLQMNEKFESGLKKWEFNGKGEKLTITFHRIYSDTELTTLGADTFYSKKSGREKDLQEWICSHLAEIDPSLTLIEREHQTGAGPVDILVARNDVLIAVEVKKTAPMNTVGQVLRYVDALREKNPLKEVEGMIMAVEFKPRTLEIAAKKQVDCLIVKYDV